MARMAAAAQTPPCPPAIPNAISTPRPSRHALPNAWRNTTATAERLQAEAARSEEAWREQMNAAHAVGQARAAEAKVKAVRDSEKRVAKADQEIAAKTETAARALAVARNSALKEIESVAAEAAREIVAKLTGAEVDESAARAAVAGALNRA